MNVSLLEFRQQLHRFQFFFRLPIERQALFTLPFLQMLSHAINVCAVEPFTRHKVSRAFEDDSHFLR